MKYLEMPKIVSINVVKIGFFYKISLRGIVLKRNFFTHSDAINYIEILHGYFGDDCCFVMKERGNEKKIC